MGIGRVFESSIRNNTHMKRILLASSVLFLSLGLSAQMQTSESSNEARSNLRVGKMRVSAFDEANARGAQAVAAIIPSNTALSSADQSLMNQVAVGGMRQLKISQAVLEKASSDEVRVLAQSEVEEQTMVANKLNEIARAKGAALPPGADAETMALVDRIRNMTAEEVNLFYIRESGIRGHELLRETMKMVNRTADDDDLESLAEATLPVIKTHLKVAKQQEKKMD